jgi:lipoprotein-releasing system permease protein
MIHDKTKEIAILKAMGMRPAQGFTLFNSIGFGMGVVGTLLGVLGGLALNRALESSGLLNLPPEIYYIQGWPIIVKRPELIAIAISAVVIALLATIYPAWKVATRPPLEGIRYE